MTTAEWVLGSAQALVSTGALSYLFYSAWDQLRTNPRGSQSAALSVPAGVALTGVATLASLAARGGSSSSPISAIDAVALAASLGLAPAGAALYLRAAHALLSRSLAQLANQTRAGLLDRALPLIPMVLAQTAIGVGVYFLFPNTQDGAAQVALMALPGSIFGLFCAFRVWRIELHAHSHVNVQRRVEKIRQRAVYGAALVLAYAGVSAIPVLSGARATWLTIGWASALVFQVGSLLIFNASNRSAPMLSRNSSQASSNGNNEATKGLLDQ